MAAIGGKPWEMACRTRVSGQMMCWTLLLIKSRLEWERDWAWVNLNVLWHGPGANSSGLILAILAYGSRVALRIVCIAKDSGLLWSMMWGIYQPKAEKATGRTGMLVADIPRSGCIAPFQALEAVTRRWHIGRRPGRTRLYGRAWPLNWSIFPGCQSGLGMSNAACTEQTRYNQRLTMPNERSWLQPQRQRTAEPVRHRASRW